MVACRAAYITAMSGTHKSSGSLGSGKVHGCLGPAVGVTVPGRAPTLKLKEAPKENEVRRLSEQQRISLEDARNRLVEDVDTQNADI
ncbi:hypothetical protein DUNSADRAFT_16855 [Dunaliella salina]|uniref:Encoded protein n=1 Tax=Dunaliella salina TaxID=3046 RepID=A0ABQ7G2R1_DUNSA|nr:hypothetical protein DUNSADRAFT_16855 [Dunaliella salina]|eukprot:KAF5828890.1 hypothetical protein DUNSADRAFT_16855 [Dunaliella salina]